MSNMRSVTDSAIEDIMEHEGWSATVYNCPAGKPTVGFGTKLPIEQFEWALLGIEPVSADDLVINKYQGIALVRFRLNNNWRNLLISVQETHGFDCRELPVSVQLGLMNMCYQLGASGTANFKKMIAAIVKGDWFGAYEEALDSKWAREDSPKRAQEVAMMFRVAGTTNA